MLRFTSLLAVLLFTAAATAQNTQPLSEPISAVTTNAPAKVATPAKTETTAPADRMVPAFPITHGSFTEFLAEHLVYPAVAEDYAIEGTVVIEVTVAPNGRVSFVGFARPLFEPLDEAARRAVEQLPRFLPAVEDGRTVARNMMIPFRFSLK